MRGLGLAFITSLMVLGCATPMPSISAGIPIANFILHAPPKVNAGMNFDVFADFNGACYPEGEQNLVGTQNGNTFRLSLFSKRAPQGVCITGAEPRRVKTQLAIDLAGEYTLVYNDAGREYKLNLAVVERTQPLETWSPPELTGLR